MPFYDDSDSFYANMKALFACVKTNHPNATSAIAAANLTIKLQLHLPEATIVIHGKQRPVVTSFGADGARADLEVDMTADTFHHILMGELHLKQAFGSGQMRVKGNILKVMTLGDLITVSRLCYPDIVQGRAGS